MTHLHEFGKQIKIHKVYVVMILKKLNWAILHNWKGSIQKHHRKSRDWDEKPTDGTSTSKKNQDGHFFKVSHTCRGKVYIHSPVARTFFLRTTRSLRTSHIFMRVTCTHGLKGAEKVPCVSSSSISPSPFSCLTRLCCSCTSTSTSRSCPYLCRTFPS